MKRVLYGHPCNVAAADQLAPSFNPPLSVRLSGAAGADVLYVVDEDAVWRGRNLYSASMAVYKLEFRSD